MFFPPKTEKNKNKNNPSLTNLMLLLHTNALRPSTSAPKSFEKY